MASSVSPRAVKRLVEQNFDIVKERSSAEELVIICPEQGCRDKSGNCSINIKKGLVHCWVCNASYRSVEAFFRHHEIDVDHEDIEEIIEDSVIDEVEKTLSEPARQVVKAVPPPAGFTRLADEPTSVYAKFIGQMARRKHLYLDDFIEAGVGFTREGSWEPYAIFPVYERGLLVYYQGRTYAKRFEGGSTKKFPSKLSVPLGASNWLYDYDELVKPDTEVVIVVESMLNVLSLKWQLRCQGITGVKPTAVFKHKISQVQLSKLLESPAKEICIMYDGDATASAWEEARKLSGVRKATVATMPVGIDANDDAPLALLQFEARQIYSQEAALCDLI